MEANCGGGELHCRGFPTTRSLREAGPKAPTLAPSSPSGSGSSELFSRRYGEETQEPFLSGFELGEHKTNRRRSAWSSGHWQRGGR